MNKKLSDIPINVHWSFYLVIAVISMTQGISGGINHGLMAMGGIILIFSMVFLHELGHCWMALKVGWEVNRINLWALGGLAELNLEALEPKKELAVILAGPAVNVILLVPCFVLWYFIQFDLFLYLTAINLILAVFNMIPAFPMDGGRILRAILMLITGNVVKSTRMACYVAWIVAALMVGVAFYLADLWLVLIAAFIYFASNAELQRIIAIHHYKSYY